MTDPIEKLRKLAEEAGLHPSPVTCRCRRCREEGTAAARDAIRALPALLDLVEAADEVRKFIPAKRTWALSSKLTDFDTKRAALAKALEGDGWLKN